MTSRRRKFSGQKAERVQAALDGLNQVIQEILPPRPARLTVITVETKIFIAGDGVDATTTRRQGV